MVQERQRGIEKMRVIGKKEEKDIRNLGTIREKEERKVRDRSDRDRERGNWVKKDHAGKVTEMEVEEWIGTINAGDRR